MTIFTTLFTGIPSQLDFAGGQRTKRNNELFLIYILL